MANDHSIQYEELCRLFISNETKIPLEKIESKRIVGQSKTEQQWTDIVV